MDDVNKQDGLVVWYNERKGYGFVHIGEDEIFLHHSTLDRFGLVLVFPGDRLAVVITEMSAARSFVKFCLSSALKQTLFPKTPPPVRMRFKE